MGVGWIHADQEGNEITYHAPDTDRWAVVVVGDRTSSGQIFRVRFSDGRELAGELPMSFVNREAVAWVGDGKED